MNNSKVSLKNISQMGNWASSESCQ